MTTKTAKETWNSMAPIGFIYAEGWLLYTFDAADDPLCVNPGGRRFHKKKKRTTTHAPTITTKQHNTVNIYDNHIACENKKKPHI